MFSVQKLWQRLKRYGVNELQDDVDFAEVPHLQDILNFLPISPDDEEDVLNYIRNVTNLIAVNYKYEQYQLDRKSVV